MLLEFPNTQFTLVVRCEGKIAYGYLLSTRQMMLVKTDGSFVASGSASNTDICTLFFSGDAYQYATLAASDNRVYAIDKVAVGKEEFDEYFALQNAKEDATWYLIGGEETE